MPIFSIIIPAYNLETYIEDTLASIAEQTFRDYEVIIVDDGSTDGTQGVCERWCQTHPQFTFFQKENGGVSSARNYALDKATGKYVWFIDGDDFIHPESLQCLKHIIEQNTDIDWITFNYDFIHVRKNNITWPTLDTTGVTVCNDMSQEGFCRKLSMTPYAACCVCIRREAIGKLRFMPICTCEDALFALQMAFKNLRIACWNAKPYYYYQRPGSFEHSTYTWKKFTDYVQYFRWLSQMKGMQHGWGDGYLSFVQARLALPHLFRSIKRLPNRAEQKQAWQLFKDLLNEHKRLFYDNTISSVRCAINHPSFIICWVVFGFRYDIQDFIASHKSILRIWRWVRG